MYKALLNCTLFSANFFAIPLEDKLLENCTVSVTWVVSELFVDFVNFYWNILKNDIYNIL